MTVNILSAFISKVYGLGSDKDCPQRETTAVINQQYGCKVSFSVYVDILI